MLSLRKPQFVRWLERRLDTVYPSKITYNNYALTYVVCISGMEYQYRMLLDTGVIVEKVTSYRTFSGYATDVLGYSVHVPTTATKPPVLEDSELSKKIMQTESDITKAEQTSDGLLVETYKFCRFINKEQMPYYVIKETVIRMGENRERDLPLEVYQLQP